MARFLSPTVRGRKTVPVQISLALARGISVLLAGDRAPIAPVSGPNVAEVLLAGDHRVLAPSGRAGSFSCRPAVLPLVAFRLSSVHGPSSSSFISLAGRGFSVLLAGDRAPFVTCIWSQRGGGPARRRPPGARTDRAGRLHLTDSSLSSSVSRCAMFRLRETFGYVSVGKNGGSGGGCVPLFDQRTVQGENG